MVKIRQQNATAEANPSATKFSKEHNDLKMKEVQKYAANHAESQYPLNLYVLGLNYSSTETEMKKAYYSMVRRFHPDKNIGLDTSKMMSMINEANDGLEYSLRADDASREEERVRAAEDKISLSSDGNYDSETSDTSSEPATS